MGQLIWLPVESSAVDGGTVRRASSSTCATDAPDTHEFFKVSAVGPEPPPGDYAGLQLQLSSTGAPKGRERMGVSDIARAGNWLLADGWVGVLCAIPPYGTITIALPEHTAVARYRARTVMPTKRARCSDMASGHPVALSR
jgi:hypothetical protein